MELLHDLFFPTSIFLSILFFSPFQDYCISLPCLPVGFLTQFLLISNFFSYPLYSIQTLYWSLTCALHVGVRGNEIAYGLARGGSALGFLGPEPVLGVSRRVIRTKLNQWLINQHWASWRDLGHTQRQARELIFQPCPGFKAKFLSFNRTQSRVVTGLLTGHNTLRRHLYPLGLIDSPLCRGCGV